MRPDMIRPRFSPGQPKTTNISQPPLRSAPPPIYHPPRTPGPIQPNRSASPPVYRPQQTPAILPKNKFSPQLMPSGQAPPVYGRKQTATNNLQARQPRQVPPVYRPAQPTLAQPK